MERRRADVHEADQKSDRTALRSCSHARPSASPRLLASMPVDSRTVSLFCGLDRWTMPSSRCPSISEISPSSSLARRARVSASAHQLLATVCDAGPRVENDIVGVVRVQLLRNSGHIVAAADLQGDRWHVLVLALLARHQFSSFPGFPIMFRSISSGGMLVRSFEISATTLSETSLCMALRRSPMIIGGAAITSCA